MSRAGTLVIRTPEGVVFSHELAGPIVRFLAWTIDLLAIILLVILTMQFIGLFEYFSDDLLPALALLSFFVILFGYHLVLEWFWRGQTLGKKLFRLRVVDALGLRLRFSQVLVRNLLRMADTMPLAFYLVGGITALINRHGQRLGDIGGNTVVVRVRQPGAPDLSRVLPDKYNSFREHPHLAARLRARVSPEAARVLFGALRRRDELDPDARLELFAELAAGLKRLVEFPESVTDGLSDEQYLRNCLDLIYRPAGK